MDNINRLYTDYKDHTVQNPVNSLKMEDLPSNAYSVHDQSIRVLTVTIQVLNEKTGEVIETIAGKAERGQIRVDADSLMRREASIRLKIDPDLFPRQGSLMWFGNICRIYVGIDDNQQVNQTINFLAGTFWIESANYLLDEKTHVITVELKDKMMKYEDIQLEYPLRIDRDTPIHDAIRALMEHIGETEFGQIDESREGEVVPYTIEYAIGEDIVDLIIELRDMYMDYVAGYDVSGAFEFRRIESQREDDVAEPKWRFDAQGKTLKTQISYEEDYNLRNIRNRIVVYGGTSSVTGITPIGESRVTDSSSPFNINAIGERTKIIVEDKYVINEQCMALAKFEAYRNANFQEKATIVTIPIYILDVYDVIEVIHPYTNIESKYMVDSISFGLGIDDEMTIKAHKLYYVSLEYGEAFEPLVEYIINGIKGYGWIRLSEEVIEKAFGIQGSGDANLNITFVDHLLGGFQASTTSYPTTVNQSLEFDLADFSEVDLTSDRGDYISTSRRDSDDSVSRIILHEMFHVVMNDYLGYNKAIIIPQYFKEGLSELVHGAHGRFESAFSHLSRTEKKKEIIKLAKWILDDNFEGSSNDYVASYMIAWAFYRIAKRNNLWEGLMYRLKKEENLAFNFLSKALPIKQDSKDIKDMLIAEMESGMDDIWDYLFQVPTKDTDTGSILGILGENYYGIPLTDENVLPIGNYNGEESIGFKLRFIK